MDSFYSILKAAHSGWRYLVLLVLIIALVKFLIGWLGKGKWSSLDAALARYTPIVLDIQWLLGALLIALYGIRFGFGGVPRTFWEHALTLTVALVVAHIGSARVGKATTDAGRFQSAALFTLGTSILVALGVFLAVGGWNLFASSL